MQKWKTFTRENYERESRKFMNGLVVIREGTFFRAGQESATTREGVHLANGESTHRLRYNQGIEHRTFIILEVPPLEMTTGDSQLPLG